MTGATIGLMRTRGFTVVEMLAGLVVVGLVLMASLGIFFDRRKRLRMANETVVVYQALSNEAEIERRVSFDSLDPNQTHPFLLDNGNPRILLALDTVSTTVAVAPLSEDVKLVTLAVRWNKGARSAYLTLVRVNTGGGNLW